MPVQKKELQNVAFEMIAMIAEPKFNALNAFKTWTVDKDTAKALAKIKDAERELGKAGQKHLELISKEAQGEDLPFSLLLSHAEDQFLSAQSLIELLGVLIHD